MDEMKMQYCRGEKHVIKEGDTLYQISRMHQVPLHLILRANPGVDVYNLQVGEEICVPDSKMHHKPQMPGRPYPGMSSQPENPEPPASSMPDGEMPAYRVVEIKKVCNLEDFLDEHDLSMETFLEYNDVSSLYLLPRIEIKLPLVDKE